MVCVQMSVGISIALGGIYLTWWNEANLVCTSGAYDQAQTQTRALDTCAKNDGLFDEFIHLTCPTGKSLQTFESSTGISAESAYYMTIETEQFAFEKTSETQLTGQQTCTEKGECKDEIESCTCLKTVWTKSPVSNNDLLYYCKKCPKDQYTFLPYDTDWGSTPPTKLGYETIYAERVPLGDGTIQIDKVDIPMIQNPQLVTLPTIPETINIFENDSYSLVASENCGESGNKLMCYKSLAKRYTVDSSSNTDLSATVIGDLRMTVRAYGSRTISAIGKQSSNYDGTASIKAAKFGDSTVPPCSAREISYITDGIKSSADIYQELHDGVRNQTYILRGLSFILIFVGLWIMFSPIKDRADRILCIGDMLASLVGCALFVVCGLLAASTWLTTFAICWLFYRPLFGAIYLATAGVLCVAAVAFVLYRRRKRKTCERENAMDFHEEPEVPVAKAVDSYVDHFNYTI